MKTIKAFTLAGLLLIVTGMQTIQAQPSHNRNHDKHEMRGQQRHQHPMSGIPDLTEEQKDKIKSLHVDHMKSILPLENQLDEKKARLKSLTTAENVNLEKVDEVIDEITSIDNKIMKSRVRHGQDIRNILTEEQRIIFNSKHHKGINRPGRPKR